MTHFLTFCALSQFHLQIFEWDGIPINCETNLIKILEINRILNKAIFTKDGKS